MGPGISALGGLLAQVSVAQLALNVSTQERNKGAWVSSYSSRPCASAEALATVVLEAAFHLSCQTPVIFGALITVITSRNETERS